MCSQQHVVQLGWDVGCTKQSGESGQAGGCGQIMEGLWLAGVCQSMSCKRLVSWSSTSSNGKGGYVRKSRSLINKLESKEAKQICFVPDFTDPPRGQRASPEATAGAILMGKMDRSTLEADQARGSSSPLLPPLRLTLCIPLMSRCTSLPPNYLPSSILLNHPAVRLFACKHLSSYTITYSHL